MVDEASIAKSFARVKKDIGKIREDLLELSDKQAELFKMLSEFKSSAAKRDSRSSSRRK
jgi:hypothetical protein